MKRIGLLGGMSWESSAKYYRLINSLIRELFGSTHSANCIMYSFNFNEIEQLQNSSNWNKLSNLMITEAQNLKKAGAEFIVICTNTMHLMYKDIENATGLKVIHIGEATAMEVRKRNIKKVLLLGTKFTMEGDFYRKKLEDEDIEVLIPDETDRDIVHSVIYDELVKGIISDKSKKQYIHIINKYEKLGVKGVILGCTEIPILIKPADVELEVFDTTSIHSKAAVLYSIQKSND